jgi:hypothetical protein
MKLRCVHPHGYRGAVAFVSGQEMEVEEQLASSLLSKFPDWFEAVGEQAKGPAVGDAEPAPAKSLPAPPRSKPFMGKGK